MQRIVVNLTLRLLFLAALLAPEIARGESMTAKVIAATDGNTLMVLSNRETYEVRLGGIVAPKPHQPFSREARRQLAKLLFQKPVTVEYNGDESSDQIVGKVTLDGRDIALEQLKTGMAWKEEQSHDELTAEDETQYTQAEEAARQAKAGLWSASNPVPPWEFKYRSRASRLLHSNGR